MIDAKAADEDLNRVLIEAQCNRLVARYAAAVDWADREGLASVFWEDARFDFGRAFFRGSGAAGVDFLIASVNASMCRTHTLGVTSVRIDGDSALGDTPAVNVWLSRNADGSISRCLFTARYAWQWQKRRDSWRASALRILITTAQCAPYDLTAQPPNFELMQAMGVGQQSFPDSSV